MRRNTDIASIANPMTDDGGAGTRGSDPRA
eukprot:SAG11_NODE_36482_length_261_cov_0.895062_1_plen_29_part_10